MSSGLLFSVISNLLVAFALIVLFPRYLQKRIPADRRPPAFQLLLKVVPPFGYLIVVVTLIMAATSVADQL